LLGQVAYRYRGSSSARCIHAGDLPGLSGLRATAAGLVGRAQPALLLWRAGRSAADEKGRIEMRTHAGGARPEKARELLRPLPRLAAGPPLPARLPQIARVDRRGFHGWCVKIKRRRKERHRYFSDAVVGGRATARAQAAQWRKAMLRRLPPPLHVWRRRTPRNTTGIVGVQALCTRSGSKRRRLIAYRASWPDGDGRTVRRSFSIKLYGRAGARRAAAQARRTGVRRLAELTRQRLLERLETASETPGKQR